MIKIKSLFYASFLAPFFAAAQEAEVTTAPVALATASSGDTAWMITATVLVLFMTLPGLALFYGGLVRSKSVISVLMHCFTIACLASVLWVAGLYSLAFAEGCAWFGGLSKLDSKEWKLLVCRVAYRRRFLSCFR